MSVYAADGVLTQDTTLAQPATVGAYGFENCIVDDTTHRALTGPTETNATMTLENCAHFCHGYNYFGTECKELPKPL